LIEGICLDKNIAGNNLKTKIGGLNSIIGQRLADGLHSIRFLGNDAAHELEEPYKNETALAINVCEGLLEFLYESALEQKTEYLKRIQEVKEQINKDHSGMHWNSKGWN